MLPMAASCGELPFCFFRPSQVAEGAHFYFNSCRKLRRTFIFISRAVASCGGRLFSFQRLSQVEEGVYFHFKGCRELRRMIFHLLQGVIIYGGVFRFPYALCGLEPQSAFPRLVLPVTTSLSKTALCEIPCISQ